MSAETPETPTGSPRLSVLVPVAAGSAEGGLAIVESLLKQDFDDWELIVVGPDEVAVPEALANRTMLVRLDRGCTLAEALGAGMAKASGEFLTILGADSILDPTALGAVCAEMDAQTDVVYSDEVIAGAEFKKPDFSAERLRSQFYLGSLAAYRTSALRAIGGVRPGFDGAEEYDFAERDLRYTRAMFELLTNDKEFADHNKRLLSQWLSDWVPRCITAARTLQPIWSQPDAKPPRFEDGLDRAKNRFSAILSGLDLDTPKELAQ